MPDEIGFKQNNKNILNFKAALVFRRGLVYNERRTMPKSCVFLLKSGEKETNNEEKVAEHNREA